MMNEQRIAVILPAAGLGSRFGGSKIELELGSVPVFLRAAQLFLARPEVVCVILAVNPETLEDFRFKWGDQLALMNVTLVPGGRRERWETIKLALAHVPDDCTHVAVHDAARPLTSDALIDRVFCAAQKYRAVIPALPTSATLKRVGKPLDSSGEADAIDALLDIEPQADRVQPVLATVDRTDVVEVQTPQVFERALLCQAYEAMDEDTSVTDDAGLVEALGEQVVVVEGESTNLKITRPADAELAHAIAALRQTQAQTHEVKALFLDDDEDD